MKAKFLFLFLLLSFSFSMLSQNALIEGYTFEIDNLGYIKNVNISVIDKATSREIAKTKSDNEGKFSVEVPLEKDFNLVASKNHFFQKSQFATTKGQAAGAKIFLKIEMERQPGYTFDVTLANPNSMEAQVDAIEGARIEVYNNTTGKQELLLKDYPLPNFKVTFSTGNHYTVMIRKDGYFTKRLEAYVNVEGCILCFDGVGDMQPNVTDVLTSNNSLGTFLSNVEMEPVVLNKSYRIENIYYDFDKWFIRPDAALQLNNLVQVLNDNPRLIVELGSHTDARGGDAYNLSLSQKRARAAVDYILEKGVYSDRISSKGYGETILVNECANGVKCGNLRHEENRRTEFKVVGILDENPLENKTLKEIIDEEKFFRENSFKSTKGN